MIKMSLPTKYERSRSTLKGRRLGEKQLADWHKECDRQRDLLARKKIDRRWIAHGCIKSSWKGEQIMTTDFVSHGRGSFGDHTITTYRGTIPILGNCYDKQFHHLKVGVCHG